MQILVVEDEAAARCGIVSILQELGVPQEKITVAEDGCQGLAKLCAHPPELAFVDIHMPHMSGFEMIREAKKVAPHTGFVLMSAYSEFEYAKEALHLGIRDYLVKPIVPEEVRALVAPYIVGESGPEPNKTCHPMVRQMLKLIDEEYASPINLASISERLNRTSEYLSYLFHRDTGVNFSTYLRHVRIEHARAMMQSGATRVYDVASACGFSDTKYFCRVFRKMTGQLPSNYLKELAIKDDS